MEPERPYAQAGYEQALKDFSTVRQQVFRFAGQTIWDRFTRSHYWSGSRQSCRAWQEAGITGFYGALHGYSSYYLNTDQNQIVSECDYWRDHTEDHLFVQTDIWIERDYRDPEAVSTTSPTRVAARLDSLLGKPWAAQNVQAFTHESFLLASADSTGVPQRIEETIAWLSQRGYSPQLDAEDSFFPSLPPPPCQVWLEELTGGGSRLSWSNRRDPEGRYQYSVLRKDMATPLGPWVQVWTGTGRWFADWKPGSYAYQVVAVDHLGRRSGGSFPLRVKVIRTPDFNGDRQVNFADFFQLAEQLSPAQKLIEPGYDLNGDGEVDWVDLTEFRQYFGREVAQGEVLIREE
jgi:hypothetical protein